MFIRILVKMVGVVGVKCWVAGMERFRDLKTVTDSVSKVLEF